MKEMRSNLEIRQSREKDCFKPVRVFRVVQASKLISGVKSVPIIGSLLVAACSVQAAPATWQELTACLFTNAEIVWEATTNHLPKNFWVYERALPHVFSASVISNAIVLGSLQAKGFPKPSKRDFFIAEDRGPNYPGPIPTIFGIRPGDANIYYSMPGDASGSGDTLPDDETVVRRAWQCASQLGLDTTKLVQKSTFSNSCEVRRGSEITNRICGRGVFLSRQLDGIDFFSADNTGEGAEGFTFELGSRSQIRAFSLRWSNMTRRESHAIASPQEIIRCVKEHRIIVLPGINEGDYFSRLRRLAEAGKLTITQITSCYGNGVFGEVPTNDVPCRFAMPFAVLEATAECGGNNEIVRMVSPIISSEVDRLLKPSSHD